MLTSQLPCMALSFGVPGGPTSPDLDLPDRWAGASRGARRKRDVCHLAGSSMVLLAIEKLCPAQKGILIQPPTPT